MPRASISIKSIQRVFVGKKPGFDVEAGGVLADIAGFLGVRYGELARLRGLRILNRYDVGRLDGDQFRRVVELVLSEPQCDEVFYGEFPPLKGNERAFAVEYLPGQYDQRADSAEQCAELVTGLRPLVRTARVFVLEADGTPVSDEALEAVKRYLINPVDSREACAELPETLEPEEREIPDVPVLAGFIRAGEERLAALRGEYGLAMSIDDLRCCRDYFGGEGRNPTLTELRILDTYWSDHCRHTTFTTVLELIDIERGEVRCRRGGEEDRPLFVGDRPLVGGTDPRLRGQAPVHGGVSLWTGVEEREGAVIRLVGEFIGEDKQKEERSAVAWPLMRRRGYYRRMSEEALEKKLRTYKIT
ncbi:MAG: hypothetical protein LBH70_03365 [Spirochaetaceae bacterium]|jgi:phosphoribosylformylglycinamidine synthase|nr:hypothetical protein [Spirochaetaceae bacterium]